MSYCEIKTPHAEYGDGAGYPGYPGKGVIPDNAWFGGITGYPG
jgi:hypothetical protein